MPEGLRDYISTDRALGHRRRKSAPALSRQKQGKGKRLSPGKACAACRASRRKCDRKKPKCSGCVKAGNKCFVKDDGQEGDEQEGWLDEGDVKTVRGEIRKGIEETMRKRERFLVQYGHLFETSLPENNYIQKLRAKFVVKKEKDAQDGEMKAEESRDTSMSGTEDTAAKPEEVIEKTNIPLVAEAVPYKLLEKQPSG